MMSTATSSFDASSSHLSALALLEASQDDRFRAELQEDPSSVLAKFGIEVDAERLPENVHLPSKQAVELSLTNCQSAIKVAGFEEAWNSFLGGNGD